MDDAEFDNETYKIITDLERKADELNQILVATLQAELAAESVRANAAEVLLVDAIANLAARITALENR